MDWGSDESCPERERFDTQILESWKSTRPARRRWPIPPACEVLGAGFPSIAPSGLLEMRRIDATSVAYQRSILATSPAAAFEHSKRCDSIKNWSLALVCRQDPARLLPASEALAGVG